MDSIRKTIFKDELRFVQLKHKLSGAVIDQIISSIFENPQTLTKQYMLKKEITSLEDLSSEISKISQNAKVIGAINTLFLIQDDLELPVELKTLFLKNEKVCVFVGAGISKILGMPLWNELGDKAIEYLYRTNKINYFEYKRVINNIIDPKQKLTIFHNLLPKNTKEAKKFYEETLTIDNKKENPYDRLIEFEWIKLTSNIDNEFINSLNRNLKQPLETEKESSQNKEILTKRANKETQNFDKSNLNNETIYYIHGSIDNLQQTVLTTKDYVETYYGDTSRLKVFLENIFNEFSVVFIGYGLEEFPILEHVIKYSKSHYAVIGAYLNEMNLFRLNSEYFKTLNITPIPFYLDFNGYDRLISVLASWIQQIRDARSQDYYQKIKDIDETT